MNIDRVTWLWTLAAATALWYIILWAVIHLVVWAIGGQPLPFHADGRA